MSQNENLQPETAENTAPQVQDDIKLKVLNNADNNNGETTESDYRRLRTQLGVQTRMRMGTRLWLGAPQTLRTTATVLDVHRVTRGARYGYNQSRAPRDGWLVIVSGGTSHGIALSAPSPARSLRQRGVSLAQGILDAVGISRSPFSIAGRKRPFAEPPHMHASMVFVGGSSAGVVLLGGGRCSWR